MLTVLLSTRNGAATLPTLLQAYCNLELPAGGWKLVMVDNRSTDTTKQIIASFSDRLPLTYEFEPHLGKNAALNTGLSHTAGDLVVFTDDDAIPGSTWLVEIRKAADSHPEFSIFAGPVVPRWEVAPEDWILTLVPLGPTFSISDSSLVEGPITQANIFGPNMAIRASLFAAGYRFCEGIGPCGLNYAMGSETELLNRLFRDGHRAWHCQRAVVEHFVRGSQLDESWVLGRAVRFGRGVYRLAALDNSLVPVRLWFGIPRHLFRQSLLELGKIGPAFLSRDRQGLFQARWRFSYLKGQAIEARHMYLQSGEDCGMRLPSGARTTRPR